MHSTRSRHILEARAKSVREQWRNAGTRPRCYSTLHSSRRARSPTRRCGSCPPPAIPRPLSCCPAASTGPMEPSVASSGLCSLTPRRCSSSSRACTCCQRTSCRLPCFSTTVAPGGSSAAMVVPSAVAAIARAAAVRSSACTHSTLLRERAPGAVADAASLHEGHRAAALHAGVALLIDAVEHIAQRRGKACGLLLAQPPAQAASSLFHLARCAALTLRPSLLLALCSLLLALCVPCSLLLALCSLLAQACVCHLFCTSAQETTTSLLVCCLDSVSPLLAERIAPTARRHARKRRPRLLCTWGRPVSTHPCHASVNPMGYAVLLPLPEQEWHACGQCWSLSVPAT